MFPCKTWFFLGEFASIFSGRNHLKVNMRSPTTHSASKSYQINSIKSCSSRWDLSNNIKGTFQFLRNLIFTYNLIQFSVKKSFNIQELLHCKSLQVSFQWKNHSIFKNFYTASQFWMKKSFNIQELLHRKSVFSEKIIQYSRTSTPQVSFQWKNHSIFKNFYTASQFWMKKSFNIQELLHRKSVFSEKIIQYSRTSTPQVSFLQWKNHSIFKNFYTASQNVMKPSWCTPPPPPPPPEISKETKNTI